ncbi:MAG TPA: hypothetical protein VF903_08405 [Nitrospirota bacterium]
MRQDQQDNHTRTEAGKEGEGEGHLLLNIGKTALLVVILVAAWFLLDWLMGGSKK